jgi:hypothetical protein
MVIAKWCVQLSGRDPGWSFLRYHLLRPPLIFYQGNYLSRESGSAALPDLREQIARENDPERLRERMLNINVLLNMIEDQVASPERRQFPRRH